MRARHRVPTLFTLSMLDVFCCALGCVILLWLWNERLARARLKAADETRHQLDYTRNDLTSARYSLESLKDELAKARNLIASLTSERDQTRADLAAARGRVDTLTGERDRTRLDLAAARKSLTDRTDELKKARDDAQGLADLLARKTKEQEKSAGDLASLLAKKKRDDEALSAQVAQARKRVDDLELLVRDRDKDLTLARSRSKDLAEQLHDLEGQLKTVRTRADTAGGLKTNLDDTTRKLAAADARVQELEKFLSTRKSVMVDMEGKLDELRSERKALTDEMIKLRLAADNRFAGIQLSGRRVVFLVDMSGSMRMTDPNTEAPHKWPTVINTVVKVMKSLPDLEKFQVIVFSVGASFPLGSDGEWIDFDAAASPERVRQVLSKVEPQGNTNMYAPFELAFRLRPKGLDTIYLLSDGLPNVGPGMTPLEQSRNLSESEKGDILGRYIRKTLREDWNRPASGLAKVRIHSIGFFYESPDVGAFLWALSREHDGSFVGMSKP